MCESEGSDRCVLWSARSLVQSFRPYSTRRSQESLKSEMLSLARTSIYKKNTNVLRINESEEDC